MTQIKIWGLFKQEEVHTIYSMKPRYRSALGRGSLIILCSTFALTNLTACSENQTPNSSPNPSVVLAAEQPVKPKQSKAAPKVQPTPSSTTNEVYQQAINTATGAVTISKSAVSRDDWNLAATQWQEAIKLLKTIPASSRKYKTAQKKLIEYQGYLEDAKLRATPQPRKSCSGDTNPEFFSVPIKERISGTPIVELKINEQKFDMAFDTGASKTLVPRWVAASLKLPVLGLGKLQIANGSYMTVPVALARSQELDGRFRVDAPIAVAPNAMQIGLLGQDFYKGYNIAVKQDFIEFRRQASIPPVSNQKSTCLVDRTPKAFFVPIIGRKHDIPIVEVTFNDQHTFSMLFDTGATSTLITHDMAKKMDLMPVGRRQAVIADGSVASFAFAFVKTQKTSELLKRYIGVGIAPPALEMGLLGQDFFEGYDFTIKENVIEFRLRE